MMDVARLNKQKSQLWWTVTILMIMCMYWLSNVVLWVPWSHNPQLGNTVDAYGESSFLGGRYLYLSGF